MIKYRIGWDKFVERDEFFNTIKELMDANPSDEDYEAQLRSYGWCQIRLKPAYGMVQKQPFFMADEGVFDIEKDMDSTEMGDDFHGNFDLARAMYLLGYRKPN